MKKIYIISQFVGVLSIKGSENVGCKLVREKHFDKFVVVNLAISILK